MISWCYVLFFCPFFIFKAWILFFSFFFFLWCWRSLCAFQAFFLFYKNDANSCTPSLTHWLAMSPCSKIKSWEYFGFSHLFSLRESKIVYFQNTKLTHMTHLFYFRKFPITMIFQIPTFIITVHECLTLACETHRSHAFFPVMWLQISALIRWLFRRVPRISSGGRCRQRIRVLSVRRKSRGRWFSGWETCHRPQVAEV